MKPINGISSVILIVNLFAAVK